jgi:hypothetical protein
MRHCFIEVDARIVVNVGPIDAAIGRAWQIGDRDKIGAVLSDVKQLTLKGNREARCRPPRRGA